MRAKQIRHILLAMIAGGGALCALPALAGNTTYQYDALGRVIKVTYPDSKQICYAYDSAGNRTQVKRQATGTCTVTGSTLASNSLMATTASSTQIADTTDSATISTTDNQGGTDSTASTTDQTATTN